MWPTDYRLACLSTAVVGIYTTSPGVISRCIVTAASRCDTGANVQARKMSTGSISSAAFRPIFDWVYVCFCYSAACDAVSCHIRGSNRVRI